jgi:dTDP-4-dehydrorhamnose 3,5-epimerase
MIKGEKDPQLVTPDGKVVGPTIEGVVVRRTNTLVDERGEIFELYNPAWGVMDAPLVYAYHILIRPGKVKGWVYHELQEDRLVPLSGAVRIVLYDMRQGSPTQGVVQEINISERNRAMVVIPRLVVHAVQNIGHEDASFINMPTRPYDHANPDKFRIDLNSGQIPYEFDRGLGW